MNIILPCNCCRRAPHRVAQSDSLLSARGARVAPKMQLACFGAATNGAKLKHVCVHPTKALVATADELSSVSVWNLQEQERLYKLDLGQLQNFLKLGPRAPPGAPAHRSSTLVLTPGPLPLKQSLRLGRVRSLCLLDDAFLEASSAVKLGSQLNVESPENAHLLRGTVLLLGTEGGVVLAQVASGSLHLISSQPLQGAAATALSPLSRQLLAIGCADGLLRLWDFRNWVLVSTLSAHAREVVQIVPTPTLPISARSSQRAEDIVDDPLQEAFASFVTIGADGSMLYWHFKIMGNIAQTDGPSALFEVPKAAAAIGAELALSYDQTSRYLYASGEGKIWGWELPAMSGFSSDARGPDTSRRPKLPLRFQFALPVLDKGAWYSFGIFFGMAPVPDGGPMFAAITTGLKYGPRLCLCFQDLRGLVDGIHFPEQNAEGLRQLGRWREWDVRALHEGLPDRLKLYELGASAVRRGSIIVGTNAGFLSLVLPGSGKAGYMRYASHPSWGDCVLHCNGKTIMKHTATRPVNFSSPGTMQIGSYEGYAPLITAQYPSMGPVGLTLVPSLRAWGYALPSNFQVLPSPSGRFVCVSYSAVHAWRIFSVSAGEEGVEQSGTKLEREGHGVFFTWINDESDDERYAYLFIDAGQTANEKKKKGFTLSRKQKETSQPLARPVFRIGLGRIETDLMSDGSGAEAPPIELPAGINAVSCLWGNGPLLALDIAAFRNRRIEATGVSRFYKIAPGESGGLTLEARGAEVPRPLFLEWDDQNRWCAMFYVGNIVIYENVNGALRPHSRRYVHAAAGAAPLSGMWAMGGLFYVTQEKVGLIVPAPLGDKEVSVEWAGYCEHHTLAAYSDGIDTNLAVKTALRGTVVPVARRPEGDVQLLGVKGAQLLLCSQETPFWCPLTAPLIKLSFLLANGEIDGARETLGEFDPLFQDHLCDIVAKFGAQELLDDLPAKSVAAELAARLS
eukprot:scaffold3854_cov251-Pinguiococcus_pyrenoidosus.AAC.3